jgi:hypothetical protein
MLVYHGTFEEQANRFVQGGIPGDVLHARAIHGLQDEEPGLFVTPRRDVARRFGLYILEIEVALSELSVPPNLRLAGATLEAALSAEFEPQAVLVSFVEPSRIRLVESHPDGYDFNPFDPTASRLSQARSDANETSPNKSLERTRER